MKIIMVGGIFPDECYEQIVNYSRGVVQNAADALQKSILCGLSVCSPNSELVNLPFIGAFPIRYRNFRIKTYDFTYRSTDNEIAATNVGFCNLLGYKNISRYYRLRKSLELKLEKINEDVVLLVYAITPSLLRACCDIKLMYSNVKIVQIVPDLPEYMSDRKNIIYKLSKKLGNFILSRCYKYVDGWVLLSRHMAERLPVKNDNWIVMEGIYNDHADDNVESWQSNDKYILYSGTLAERYGVQTLIRAFHKNKLTDVKLYVCGAGDSQRMIESYCFKDSRIKYLGQLHREDVLRFQKRASLLVNPRTPDGEFTKFSFPSKTMEYMASGVPVLMYRLPGVPDEYFKYCYVVEESGEENLAEALASVFNKSTEERNSIGQSAREFILKHKNPISQIGKVVEFINTL